MNCTVQPQELPLQLSPHTLCITVCEGIKYTRIPRYRGRWTCSVFYHKLIDVNGILISSPVNTQSFWSALTQLVVCTKHFYLSLFTHSSLTTVLLQSPQRHLISSPHAVQSSYGQLTLQRQINEKLILLIRCKGLFSILTWWAATRLNQIIIIIMNLIYEPL